MRRHVEQDVRIQGLDDTFHFLDDLLAHCIGFVEQNNIGELDLVDKSGPSTYARRPM